MKRTLGRYAGPIFLAAIGASLAALAYIVATGW